MHVAATLGQSVSVCTASSVQCTAFMAHLHWGSHNHGCDLVPEPWSNMRDMLPPAFRVQSSEPDTPAKARGALLSQETPSGNVGVGKLYVGDSKSAVQWAGEHVAYIINCADINYAWHPWCPRFWLNLGFRGVFDELDWPARMMTAVKLVMLALMFGQEVLIHCRQGKHRSGALCILMLALLWDCSIWVALEWYWSGRGDLKDHDYWVLDKILFRKNDFNALVERVRQQSWFPKARGNILNRLWAFSVQRPTPGAGRGDRPKAQEKKMPRVKQQAKKMPRPTSAQGERGTPRQTSHPESSRQTSPPREQRSASSSEARGDISRVPLRTSSSSSGSSDCLRLQPCHVCRQMPWSCKCNVAHRSELMAAFFPRSASTADSMTEPQISAELFHRISVRAGIWADAEEAEHIATELRDRSRSPSVEPEDKEAWECVMCRSLNSQYVLYCELATCGSRRPLVQKWRRGDYYCKDCGNHRYSSSQWCNWAHCHSNDWTCPGCQNLNFANRKKCHTRSCQRPRDWTCPRCGLVNWIFRQVCKDCQHPKP